MRFGRLGRYLSFDDDQGGSGERRCGRIGRAQNFESATTVRGFKLPHDLAIHQPYIDGLLVKDGLLHAEQKVALGRTSVRLGTSLRAKG